MKQKFQKFYLLDVKIVGLNDPDLPLNPVPHSVGTSKNLDVENFSKFENCPLFLLVLKFAKFSAENSSCGDFGGFSAIFSPKKINKYLNNIKL